MTIFIVSKFVLLLEFMTMLLLNSHILNLMNFKNAFYFIVIIAHICEK